MERVLNGRLKVPPKNQRAGVADRLKQARIIAIAFFRAVIVDSVGWRVLMSCR